MMMFALLLTAIPLISDCTPTPNSTGAPALIAYDGEMNFSCVQLPPVAFTCLTAGPVAWEVPFGDGVSCISPMLGWMRTSASVSDASGQVSYYMGSHPALLSMPPGSALHVQAWYRDPGHGSFGFNLSGRVTLRL